MSTSEKMIIEVSKGKQITIPVEFREEFDLDVGSKVEIIKEKGRIILQPIDSDLTSLFKEAKKVKPKHDLTPEQMDELNERLFR